MAKHIMLVVIAQKVPLMLSEKRRSFKKSMVDIES